jgi:hypothetical protein
MSKKEYTFIEGNNNEVSGRCDAFMITLLFEITAMMNLKLLRDLAPPKTPTLFHKYRHRERFADDSHCPWR